MTLPRGEWHYPDRARQLLSFRGLRWGTITPTDFDLFIDYGGRAFVLGEIKREGVDTPVGQLLALERATDAWRRAGVPCLTLIAAHTTDIGDVMIRDARVLRFRYRGRWEWMRNHLTVGEMIDRFYRRVVMACA